MPIVLQCIMQQVPSQAHAVSMPVVEQHATVQMF